MSFRELDIQPCYDSGRDDVLNEFYLPVLGESTEYVRLAGYFSSTAFAVAARGIAGLLENDGRMKLIAGAVLRKKDVDAISDGLEKPSEVIERVAMEDFDSIEDEFVRNHVRALGWMIAKGKLEIRVAVVKDRDGSPLDATSVLRSGIFHQKIGIFTDAEGQMISFSGSVNETARAWIENVEEFKVFRSWIDGEYEHFCSDYEMFNRYWNGETDRVEILEIPDAVRKHLIQMAPDNLDMLDLDWKPQKKTYQVPSWVKPIDYQDEAVDKWFSNGMRGMLEMATGTGKTIVALKAVCKYLQEEPRGVIIVACPQTHLVTQWKNISSEFNFNPILCYKSRKSWEDKLNDMIIDYNHGFRDLIFIITTHTTFSLDPMQNAIECIKGSRIVLVADEVHHLGASKSRQSLPESITARMGLSATPDRVYDLEGTSVLRNYFGGTVFEYPLKKAIENGYLCRYRYFPHVIELDEDELDEYLQLTKKIGRRSAMLKDKSADDDDTLNNLFRKRTDVINKANGKIDKIRELITIDRDMHNTLFYCAPGQLEPVLKILGESGLRVHRFTHETPESERGRLLLDFDKGKIQALVAMRCLDEGVDVPGTQTAYFIASTSNPVQFIQRRGRILRTAKGKSEAILHDLIVVPYLDDPKNNLSAEEFNIERRILKRELARFKEFVDAAENYFEANEKILDVATAYNILDF